jgi:hypothetical protein
MKTTFTLDKPNVKLARQIDSTKAQINKYVKRERGKKLPEGVDFWDFSCKFGDTQENARPCHLKDITKFIDEAEANLQTSFYVEIIAVEGRRKKR